jgi:8-oxo-dGTP diphosphatase
MEETGMKEAYLEQLYTFGNPKRDPRGRIISVSYFALMPSSKISKLRADTDTKEVKWFPVYKLPKLAFDHEKIVSYAIKRLKWKMEYTNVVYSLLDEEFTLTDLQKIYEIIFNKKFDKRNFRRKIKSLGLIEATGRRVVRGVQRPAATYKFKSKKLSIVDIA